MSLRTLFAAVALSLAVAAPAYADGKDAKKEAVGPKKDAASYVVELKANGPYKAGAEGKLVLSLTPKAGYHVNPDYPAKLKLQDPAPEGVTFPKKVLKKEDGKFEEKAASLDVPFTVAKAGKAKIAGTFQFSVCSDKNCFMEKADLELEVEAK